MNLAEKQVELTSQLAALKNGQDRLAFLVEKAKSASAARAGTARGGKFDSRLSRQTLVRSSIPRRQMFFPLRFRFARGQGHRRPALRLLQRPRAGGNSRARSRNFSRRSASRSTSRPTAATRCPKSGTHPAIRRGPFRHEDEELLFEFRLCVDDMKFYDAHNHLQDDRFAGRQNELLAACEKAGVVRMVVNGACESDWPQVLALARENKMVLPSFGYHPWYLPERTPDWLKQLGKVSRRNSQRRRRNRPRPLETGFELRRPGGGFSRAAAKSPPSAICP